MSLYLVQSVPGEKRTPFVLYRYKVRGVPRLVHCATLERVAIRIAYATRQTELFIGNILFPIRCYDLCLSGSIKIILIQAVDHSEATKLFGAY